VSTRNEVAVLDTSTLAITGFIPNVFANAGEGLALSPDGGRLYLGGQVPSALLGTPYPPPSGAMIDTQSLQVIGVFPAGDEFGAPIVVH
jgi:hypothetical protein